MQRARVRKTYQLCSAAALAAIGAAAVPAFAQNLLVNPGFESPQAPATGANQDITGWQQVSGEGYRAVFNQMDPGHPTPDTSDWGQWLRTFIPLNAAPPAFPIGGGLFQDVTGITPGANYELSSFMLFEANFTMITDPTAVRMAMNFLDAGGSTIGSPSMFDVTPGDNPTADQWLPFSFSATAPAGAATVRVFLGWDGGQSVGGAQSAFIDNVQLLGPGTPPSNFWAVDNSGDWNSGGNWALGSVPNGVGAQAEFLGAITSAQTVFTNTPVTVGSMRFNNANTYVLAGAGSLTLEVSSGSAAINVDQGSHKINLPVRINSNTNITVAGGAALNMADPVTIAASRTVNTSGNVQFNAPLTLESSSALSLGSNARMFEAPSIGSGARVDINTNAVVFDYNAGSSAPATIKSQVVSGYNGGAWNGQGIISSDANTSTHGVGYADASDLTTVPAVFGSVDDTAMLVRYTRYGDANVDGIVNLADFNALAGNFGQSNRDWVEGDFNYDSLVNLADFNLLAGNFGLQAGPDGPTAGDWAALAAAVPEPSALALVALGAMPLMRRRRSA